MLTLLHHPMSAKSRFIRLILREYHIDFHLQLENTWEKRPNFRLLNPAGTLPVLLTTEDKAICDAYVIAEYIDETCGIFKRDHRIFPEDPLPRAETRRLIFWFLDKFNQEVTHPLTFERVFKRLMPSIAGGGEPDSTILRQARSNINPHMKYLEWLAASRDWLAGDIFSYADLAAAAEISVLDYTAEIEWDVYPIAREWYARVKSRPAFQPLLKDRVQGLAPSSHYADLDF